MNKDFEKGMEFILIEERIKNLYEIINLPQIAKTPLVHGLRNKLSDNFQNYLKIGFDYEVNPKKFKKMERYYCLGMGFEWPNSA